MSKIENSSDRLNSDNTVYYILTPYKALISRTLKITYFAFAAYIFSANEVLFCIMMPVYILCFYLYCKLWLMCKKHTFKPLPFITFMVLFNIPFIVLSFYIRALFLNLFSFLKEISWNIHSFL